jgi:hypothetical protein
MLRNRLIHGAIQPRDQRLKVRPLTARSQPNPRLIGCGRHRLEAIDSQIHPHTRERVLNNHRDARFSRAWRPIQNHDLSWRKALVHLAHEKFSD